MLKGSSNNFESNWKLITEALQAGRLPDEKTIQGFLYGSIDFVPGFKDETKEPKPLQLWLDLMEELLPMLVNKHEEWNRRGLQYNTVLIYLNHLLFHVFNLKSQPVSCLKSLGWTVFHLLSAYMTSQEEQKETQVLYKTYSMLAATAQRLHKSESAARSRAELQQIFELYMLAACVLNLDATNQNRDGLSLARDSLVKYRQVSSDLVSSTSKSNGGNNVSDFLQYLISLGVRSYTAQPRKLSDGASLSFYLELFKLSKWHPSITEKLFDCEGDLFKYKLNDSSLQSFSEVSFNCLRQSNHEASLQLQPPQENGTKDIVLPILQLCQLLHNLIGARNMSGLDKKIESNDNFLATVEQISTLLSDNPRPLSLPVGDALSMLVKVIPDNVKIQQQINVGALRSCLTFVSLAVRVLVRDVLRHAGKTDQASATSTHNKIYELVVACRLRNSLVQTLVTRLSSDVEEMTQIANQIKPCLQALTQLASRVNQKKLLEESSLYYAQVFKCLECALFSIGSLGRNFRRQRKCESGLAFLTPLWPVANIPELLQYVNYHESIASLFYESGQLDKAVAVVRACASIDPRLITEVLLKTLAKVADQKLGLNILAVFEPCSADPPMHAQLLAQTAQVMLMISTPTAALGLHIDTLLSALRGHAGVSRAERGVFTYLLAEHRWFYTPQDRKGSAVLGSEDASKSVEGCLDLAQEAMQMLRSSHSHEYDDYFAQAALLYWDILNRLSCLQRLTQTPDGYSQLSTKDESNMTTPTADPKLPSKDSRRRRPFTSTDSMESLDLTLDCGNVTAEFRPTSQLGHDDLILGKSDLKVSVPVASPPQYHVDAEILAQKARLCLSVWTAWFQGQSKDAPPLDLFRVTKSLGFLNKMAELFRACHELLPAIQALCRGRQLSLLFKKTDATRRLTGAIVSTLVQFRMSVCCREKCACAHSTPDNTPSGSVCCTCLMEKLDLDEDCHVLELASVAGHLLHTGQVKEFMVLRATILSRIEEQRKKTPLTPNCTITLCLIHRLTAQLYYSPASNVLCDSMGCQAAESEPYPLDCGSDSLKYISSVASFYMGDEFKGQARGASVEMWHVIHEYLTTSLAHGEMYAQAGNLKYARTHLTEGLRVSRSCLMMGWSIIFMSRLAELSVESSDGLGDTHLTVMQGQGVVDTYWRSQTDKLKSSGKQGTLNCCGHITDSNETKLKDELTTSPTMLETPCWADLLSVTEPQMSTRQREALGLPPAKIDQPSTADVLSMISSDIDKIDSPQTCALCYKHEITLAMSKLMCVRAELCHRAAASQDVQDKCIKLAHQAASSNPSDHSQLVDAAQEALVDAGLCDLWVNAPTAQDMKQVELAVAAFETEMKFRDLCTVKISESPEVKERTKGPGSLSNPGRDLDEGVNTGERLLEYQKRVETLDADEVNSLLELVEDGCEGDTRRVGDIRSMLLARAQLMRLHMHYVPALQANTGTTQRTSLEADVGAGDDPQLSLMEDEKIIQASDKVKVKERKKREKERDARLNLPPVAMMDESAVDHEVWRNPAKTKPGSAVSSKHYVPSLREVQATGCWSLRMYSRHKAQWVFDSVSNKSGSSTSEKSSQRIPATPLTSSTTSKVRPQIFSDFEGGFSTPLRGSVKSLGDRSVKTTSKKNMSSSRTVKASRSTSQISTPSEEKENSFSVEDCATGSSTKKKSSLSPLANDLKLLNINQSESAAEITDHYGVSSSGTSSGKNKRSAKSDKAPTTAKTSRTQQKSRTGKTQQVVDFSSNNNNTVGDCFDFVSTPPILKLSSSTLGEESCTSMKKKRVPSSVKLDTEEVLIEEEAKPTRQRKGRGRQAKNENTSGGRRAKVDSDVSDVSPEKVRKYADGDDGEDYCSSQRAGRSQAARGGRRKVKKGMIMSPECNRLKDSDGDMSVGLAGLGSLDSFVVEKLALSPGNQSLDSTSESLPNSPSQTVSCSDVSLQNIDGRSCGKIVLSQKLTKTIDGPGFCDEDESMHHEDANALIDAGRATGRLIYLQDGFSSLNAASDVSASALFSPAEIPRGRPQRKNAATTKQTKKEPSLTLQSPAEVNKENVISGTPEREPRLMLLGTPASRQKPIISSRKVSKSLLLSNSTTASSMKSKDASSSVLDEGAEVTSKSGANRRGKALRGRQVRTDEVTESTGESTGEGKTGDKSHVIEEEEVEAGEKSKVSSEHGQDEELLTRKVGKAARQTGRPARTGGKSKVVVHEDEGREECGATGSSQKRRSGLSGGGASRCKNGRTEKVQAGQTESQDEKVEIGNVTAPDCDSEEREGVAGVACKSKDVGKGQTVKYVRGTNARGTTRGIKQQVSSSPISPEAVQSKKGSSQSPTSVLREEFFKLELDDIDNSELTVESVPDTEMSGYCGDRGTKNSGNVSGRSHKPVGKKSDKSSMDENDKTRKCSSQEVEKENLNHCGIAPSSSSKDDRRLFQNFPFLSVSPVDQERVASLENLCQQFQRFPPSFLYSQMNKTIAICEWERNLRADSNSVPDHKKVAAHLTTSMHVTYQHIMTRNLRTKLRKMKKESVVKDAPSAASTTVTGEDVSDDEWATDEKQLDRDRTKMGAALKDITFRGCPVDRLDERLRLLPPDYTVVQLSVVDFDPLHPSQGQGLVLVTRMCRDLPPITVAIPADRMACLQRAMRVFDKSIKLVSSFKTLEEYWTRRYKNNSHVMSVIDYLQLEFLSSHIPMMLGRVLELQHKEACTLVDREAQLIVAEMEGCPDLNVGMIRALLEMLLYSISDDIQTLLSCMWSDHTASRLAQLFIAAQARLLGNPGPEECSGSYRLKDRRGSERGPVVLILDKTLSRLPWESMPALLDQTVTRVPSLASLCLLLRLHAERVAAPDDLGTDKHDAVAVVDPESNLQYSVEHLLPQFQQIRGWTCLAQKPPTVSDLKAILTEHSLYIYCGHGWGKQFVGGDDLQMFRGKAVAVVMGCHSNNLEHSARTDGDGAPLYFLLAGCPAVVGNLWVVTDKDIDKLTSDLVSQWMKPAAPAVGLCSSLMRARTACKMVALNGFSPVIYGLPVNLV